MSEHSPATEHILELKKRIAADAEKIDGLQVELDTARSSHEITLRLAKEKIAELEASKVLTDWYFSQRKYKITPQVDVMFLLHDTQPEQGRYSALLGYSEQEAAWPNAAEAIKAAREVSGE